MNIAFVMASPVLSVSNGVRMQALTWKQGLEALGHRVDLVDMWNRNDWASYDIVHCFEFGDYFFQLVTKLRRVNPRIVLSPIIDHNYSPYLYKLATYWGCSCLRLYSKYYQLRCVKEHVKMFFVRSAYEGRLVQVGYGVEAERIAKVPLPCRMEPILENSGKEQFCLHVSILSDARKNVARLVAAAKKYGFELVLAGKLRSEEEKIWLHGIMDDSPNIRYLGFLSEKDLMDLYRRARVFALPSVYEGVGLVALEAAAMGCNIVLTNKGGPKEYFADLANLVDPLSVDSIGHGVLSALQDRSQQPRLRDHIANQYSLSALMPRLVESYRKVMESP